MSVAEETEVFDERVLESNIVSSQIEASAAVFKVRCSQAATKK